MTLLDLLREKRREIVDRWVDETLAIYPASAAGFLRGSKDPFSNPVGTTIHGELGALVDGLLEQRARNRMSASLDRIVQITCIQDVPPSTAVGFVNRLKDVIRSVLPDAEPAGSWAASLGRLEREIDGLALLGFDSYVRQLQTLHRIREREIKARVSTLLKMSETTWSSPPTCEQSAEGCDRCESRSP